MGTTKGYYYSDENLINENYILKFGKYKAQNIIDLAEKDPNYCIWLLKQPSLIKYEDIKDFLEHKFVDKNEVYLTFGKYKGKTLTYVKGRDPEYIEYLKKNDFVKEKMNSLYEKL